MKKTLLALLLLSLALFACKKQAPGTGTETSGTETAGQETEKDIVLIPSIIKFERGAGLYIQTGDKELEYADTRLEQFDLVQFLGEEKKMNYTEGGKKTSDTFSQCLVPMGGEQKEFWIYTENLAYNANVGVILNDGLLYSKDKLDKISDKEVKSTALVIVDVDYFHKDFFKIWVPAISTKTPWYVRKSDLSLSANDVAVARLYKTAMALGEGKEKAKGQILQSAYSEYPQSAFLPLVENELLNMGLLNVDDGGGYYEEDAGMGDEGYYDEDAGIGDEGEY